MLSLFEQLREERYELDKKINRMASERAKKAEEKAREGRGKYGTWWYLRENPSSRIVGDPEEWKEID